MKISHVVSNSVEQFHVQELSGVFFLYRL